MLSKKNERCPPRRYWTLCFDVARRTSMPASFISRSSRAVSNGAVAGRLVTSSMMDLPGAKAFRRYYPSKPIDKDEPVNPFQLADPPCAKCLAGDPARSLRRGLSGRFGGRFGGLAADHSPEFSSASGRAIEDELDRSDFNPVTPGILGAIERMIGLRQQGRQVQHRVVADDNTNADGRDDRRAVHIEGGLGEAKPYLLGDRQSALARSVAQHGCELLAAEAAEQVDVTHRAAAYLSKNLQNAIADGVAEAIVDRFEVVDVEQHHRQRPRICCLAFELRFTVLQKRSTVGDAGQRINQGSSLVALLGSLLGHGQQNESDSDREQQRFEAEHRKPNAVEDFVCRRQPRQHGAERRAQQIKRPVREQQKYCRPARNQRLIAAAPEFIRCGPGVGGDYSRAQEYAKLECASEPWHMAESEPKRRAGKHQYRFGFAMIEDPRTRPRQSKGGEQ